MKTALVPLRILTALKARPMTVAELVPVVHSTVQHVRVVVSGLEQTGAIRRGAVAPRHFNKGAVPRYWEIAT